MAAARARESDRPRSRIQKNDMVMVIAGRDRGKTGKVMRVMPESRAGGDRAAQCRQAPFAGRAAPPVRAESSRRKRRRFLNVMIFCDRCNAPVRIGIKAAADGAADADLPALRRITG